MLPGWHMVSKAKIVAAQGRYVDRVAQNFRARIERELTAATEEAVRFWQLTGTVPMIPTERLTQIYAGLIEEAVLAFVSGVKSHGVPLEAKSFADIMRNIARAFIGQEAIRRRIVGVANTTRAIIIRQVDAGYAEGLGVAEIAKSITEEAPRISRTRAALISRTETHGAANYGAWQAAKQSGVPMEKEWVSVEDHRTRRFSEGDEFDHAMMNGVRVGMDEPFQLPMRDGSIALALYPGDPAAPAACSINCRCALTFEVSLDSLLDGIL